MRLSSSLTRRVVGLVLAVAVLGILSAGAAVYMVSRRTMTAQAIAELTHVVDTTAAMVRQSTHQAVINHLRAISQTNRAMVANLYDEYKTGEITESEAKRRATKLLLSQKIGSSGYIFCLSSRGVVQVHPKSELVGKDVTSYAFIREVLTKPVGYQEYLWKNPDDTVARPKAQYLAYFEPWDWIIAVSSYREEFTSLVSANDFRDEVLSIHLAETGYLSILDGQGTFLVHPILAGMNMLRSSDPQHRAIIKQLLANKDGVLNYWWRDSPGGPLREKLLVYRHNPTFNWSIVGTVYADELYRPLRKVKLAVLLILTILAPIAVLLSIFLGRRVVSSEEAAGLALRASLEATQTIVDKVPFALVLIDKDLTIQRANDAAGRILCLSPRELKGRSWREFCPTCPSGTVVVGKSEEVEAINAAGNRLSLLRTIIPIVIEGTEVYIDAFLDLTERKRLETELGQAQKLESVGRLAAGIAHEINTPMQFVGDNLYFLKEAFTDQRKLLEIYRRSTALLLANCPSEEAVALREAENSADLEYADQNVPEAFERAQDGVSRVSSIVAAMKEFAHPDLREKSMADLNHALTTTLTVARSEYKYLADIETDLGNLPPVLCHPGDINQVFLNLIVNAAHAIGDVVGTSGAKGLIRVKTMREGQDAVRIDISDSGAGIPVAIRDRIFDPFFTTKGVGKGTGQGLAIARSVVVDKHGGLLRFESEVGQGTTFTIILPIDQPSAPDEAVTSTLNVGI